MFRSGAVVLTILLSFVVDAAAQQTPSQKPPAPFPNPFHEMMQGTPEEQAACRPDSTRYCKDAEPDPLVVLACLQRNRTKISARCLRVLESHGQ
jgi:hypothetical protein